MSVLHNRISNKELKEKLYQENFPRTTISFYKYFSISDPVAFRDELYRGLLELQVFGRIYIAQEGINAQISVPTHLFENFKTLLPTNEYKLPELSKRNHLLLLVAPGYWLFACKKSTYPVPPFVLAPLTDNTASC